MAALDYVGATPASPADLTHKGYVGTVTAGNMTQTTVTSLLNTGFASNVLKSYVDAQDALNATAAFIDAGDAAKLHLSQLGVNSGVVGLDSSGRIEASRINVASLQRWPKPFVSPSAYNASSVTATGTTEVQLIAPITVADPGFVYRLLITGSFDATTTVDGTYPIVRVRQGSLTGPLVAIGRGLAETYFVGTRTAFTTAGTFTYTPPTGFTNLDAIAVGGGQFSVFSQGGLAGAFSSTTWAYAALPATLSVTVGAGGVSPFGPNGANSTVSGTGLTTVTGAGATGNTSTTTGASPGTFSLHGQNYVGGAAQTANADGIAPGGGAGGDGKNGAPGAVWFFPYGAQNPSGPVRVTPYPINFQTSLSGANTLYVTLAASATGSVTVSTLRPSLYVLPVPA